MLERAHTTAAALAQETLEEVLKHLVTLDPDEAQWYSKDALRTLADVAQVALLYDLAEYAGERYAKLAALYAQRFLNHASYFDWAVSDREVWWPLVDASRAV